MGLITPRDVHTHGHLHPFESEILGYGIGTRVRVLAHHGDEYLLLLPDEERVRVSYDSLVWFPEGGCRWCDGVGPEDEFDEVDLTEVLGLMMDHDLTPLEANEAWAGCTGRTPEGIARRILPLARREALMGIAQDLAPLAASAPAMDASPRETLTPRRAGALVLVA